MKIQDTKLDQSALQRDSVQAPSSPIGTGSDQWLSALREKTATAFEKPPTSDVSVPGGSEAKGNTLTAGGGQDMGGMMAVLQQLIEKLEAMLQGNAGGEAGESGGPPPAPETAAGGNSPRPPSGAEAGSEKPGGLSGTEGDKGERGSRRPRGERPDDPERTRRPRRERPVDEPRVREGKVADQGGGSDTKSVGGGKKAMESDASSSATPGGTEGKADGSMGSAVGDTSKDLFIMGYDFKPDPDDLQSAIASKMAVDKLGLNALAVSGTTGNQSGKSLEGKGQQILDGLYGKDGYVDAKSADSADQVASKIAQTIDNGGKVRWAEGGQTQFAEKVMDKLNEQGYDTKANVSLYQHSDWNEKHSGDLSGIKAKTNYNKIADGNDAGNGTASFRGNAPERAEEAMNSKYGDLWKMAMAEGTYGEQVDFDFSDSVELVNGALGMDEVQSIDDFWNTFGDDAPTPAMGGTAPGGGAPGGAASGGAPMDGSSAPGKAMNFTDKGLEIGSDWGGWDGVSAGEANSSHDVEDRNAMFSMLKSAFGLSAGDAEKVTIALHSAAKATKLDAEKGQHSDAQAEQIKAQNHSNIKTAFSSLQEGAGVNDIIAAIQRAYGM